jgi:hypothetical protein
MSTFADALKALEAVEGGADLVLAVNGEISKLRTESASHRTKLRAQEERTKALAGHLGIDASVDDLEGALETLKGKPGKSGELAALEARLAALQKTVETSTKSAQDERAKRIQTETKAAIKDALAKNKALSPDDLTELLATRVKLDGETVQFLAEDGQALSIADGVAAWLKARPAFVGSSQNPGPGGPKNGTPPGVATITRSQYNQQKTNPYIVTQITEGKLVIIDD